MKKRGLLLLIFIILIPNSFAIIEELYEGTILDAQSVTIDGINFTFTVLSDANIVFISWEDSSISLNGYVNETAEMNATNETTQTTETNCDEKNGFYLCVGKIEFSHTDTETKTRHYSAPVTVSKVITEVKMFREIDNTDLLIGQKFTVKTLLENRGTIEAKDVSFIDYFPDDFMMNLAEVEGCKISGKNIIFKGTIAVNGKKECTYTLTALKGIKYNSKATLSYYNGMEKKETTNEETINVANYSVEISKSLNKSALNIGDDFLLNLEIKNKNEDSDISPELNIEIPDKLKIIKKTSGFEQTMSGLKWKDEILAGESKNLSIAFKADYFGEFDIKYNAKYNIDSLRRETSDEIKINVTKPELTISFDAPVEIEQNKESKIRIKIVNKNEEISFNDLNIKTENDLNLTNIDKLAGKIEKCESFLVLDTDFITPFVNEDSIFYYNITISYKTEDGQIITTKKSIPIEVKAYKQEETQLEGYDEGQILEEDVQEKEGIANEEEKEDIIYEEEKEDVYSPYTSIFIKIMFTIGAFLVVSLIILKFRRKSKEQKPVLGKLEEETKERKGETEKVEKEEKREYKKEEEVEKPKEEKKGEVEKPKEGYYKKEEETEEKPKEKYYEKKKATEEAEEVEEKEKVKETKENLKVQEQKEETDEDKKELP